MIQLGNTLFWLDTAPNGEGWVIFEKPGGKRARTQVVGTYTSPRHAVQCKPQIPKEALAAVEDLAAAMEIGDWLLDALPQAPAG